jgi:hypothetical protein
MLYLRVGARKRATLGDSKFHVRSLCFCPQREENMNSPIRLLKREVLLKHFRHSFHLLTNASLLVAVAGPAAAGLLELPSLGADERLRVGVRESRSTSEVAVGLASGTTS